MPLPFVDRSNSSLPVQFVTPSKWRAWVKEQNAKEFHELLNKALAIDVNDSPEDRLANVLMQRRAAWLLKMSGDLFLEDTGS